MESLQSLILFGFSKAVWDSAKSNGDNLSNRFSPGLAGIRLPWAITA
jgi:hypothetical protein